MNQTKPIGIFDSGYGGLTILKEIRKLLPQYDYVYFGDNARTPYGTRSFEVVYQYTREAVMQLFDMNCHLVILACNTASAKALRTIQQRDLPQVAPNRRVLGVIRPSVEVVNEITQTKHIGVLGTPGTVLSKSYVLELDKISDGKLVTTQEACPMWVPIVENNEIGTPGADYFVEKNVNNLLKTDSQIDTLILGCTHYPLLIDSIRKYIPQGIRIVEQGEIVAIKLKEYLERHPEIDDQISKQGNITYFTTERTENFEEKASIFMKETIQAISITL
jgi:glutamate racemase